MEPLFYHHSIINSYRETVCDTRFLYPYRLEVMGCEVLAR